jgi:hypothetical protein
LNRKSPAAFFDPSREKAMANSQTTRGRNQDRARVAEGQDHEVRYEGQDRRQQGRGEAAVKSVGNSRKKVENKLDKP